jgi:hypothetical protein
MLQNPSTDYSLSGKMITFAAASIPRAGDNLQVSYRLATGVQAPGFVDNEIPQGNINGSNLAFSLAKSPVSGTLRLYKNGALLQAGVDYTLTATAITFASTGSAPSSGDTLIAYYRSTN